MVPASGRWHVKVLGGLRGKVEGFLGGMLPLTGGLEEIDARGLSGDLSASAGLGFAEGVATRGGSLSTGAIMSDSQRLSGVSHQ